jgi:hypothetical protein
MDTATPTTPPICLKKFNAAVPLAMFFFSTVTCSGMMRTSPGSHLSIKDFHKKEV